MGWIAITCVFWLIVLAQADVPATHNSAAQHITGDFLDICTAGLVQLKGVNETGRIGIDTVSLNKNNPNPCILKIESCPTCQVIIEPDTSQNFTFFCQTDLPDLKHHCSLGCDYLYMFDMYYVNQTVRVVRQWSDSLTPYRSQSSSLYVVLCHGYSKEYTFAFKYRTIKKLTEIHGSSNFLDTGALMSPFFPTGYHQNFETYTYIFSSSRSLDFIYLTFDDWNLDGSSAFYFENSDTGGPIYGSSDRPVVVSKSNTMKVVFNTGQPVFTSQRTMYMGFKATYRFIKDLNDIQKPNTGCKGSGYILNSPGGQIEFTKDTPKIGYYDCIWVVKKLPGYSGVYLKLTKKSLRDRVPFGKNQIMIRYGVTSAGGIVDVIGSGLNVNTYRPHTDEVGFYIRINATLESRDTVILAYSSYKETYSTMCKSDTSMFTCNNARCIDKSLICDQVDHCGDNTDETTGCSYDDTAYWDQSYQYTITIGVIVPMVISVFLIMVICLLFVMIRRCRRARLREAEANDRLNTLSEEVSTRRGRRRRRRRHRFFGRGEADAPPTYDEAIQNPPGWYDNVAFGPSVDPTLPQPPSYTEAIGVEHRSTLPSLNPGSPSSTDSSQSDIRSHIDNQVSSSSSSEGGSPWDIGRRQTPRNHQRSNTTHVSSSESESEEAGVLNDQQTRNRGDSTTAGGTEESSGSPKTNNKRIAKGPNTVDTQNSELSNKHSDKTLQKSGPSTYNFVIPDSNKVGSSRSMEVLPTLTLAGASSDSNERADRSEGRQSRPKELRTGGPTSPKNGSCPVLTGSLSIHQEETDLQQLPSSNTYPTQQHIEQRNKNRTGDRSGYRDSVALTNVATSQDNQKNYEAQSRTSHDDHRNYEAQSRTTSPNNHRNYEEQARTTSPNNHRNYEEQARTTSPNNHRNYEAQSRTTSLNNHRNYEAQSRTASRDDNRNNEAQSRIHSRGDPRFKPGNDEAISRTPGYDDHSSSQPHVQDCEPRQSPRKTGEPLKRDNRHLPTNNKPSCESQNEVMVVYDGPAMQCPKNNTSPSRMPAYLLSNDVSPRNHSNGKKQNTNTGNNENLSYNSRNSETPSNHGNRRETPSYHRNSKNQKIENIPSPNKGNMSGHGTTESQQKDNLDTSPVHGNDSYNAQANRRLRHLPIINQMRRTDTAQARASQATGGNKQGDINEPKQANHRGDDVYSASQTPRGESGTDRHVPRQESYVSPSRRVPDVGNVQTRAGNDERRVDHRDLPQSNTGAAIHGQESHQSDSGAVMNRHDKTDADDGGYLNLYRMGGEDDDVYV